MEEFLPDFANKLLHNGIEHIYSLAPLFEPTVVLVPAAVKTHVLGLSEAIGFDVETLNYVLGLLLCYPLAMIMNLLPYGYIRHVFSFLLGAFLLQFTLGVQWIHQLITSLIAYVLFLTLPRKLNTTIVPTFIMIYLVCGHLHRQYTNYLGYDLDFTSAQMVLTQKLYMMAYNLYDGEVLRTGGSDRASKKCADFALPKLPGIIEFLGYTFCFSNVLSGPAYEYTIYCQSCEGTLLYDKAGKLRGKAIPSNVWPTLRPFITSILCLGLFVVGGSYFPLLDPSDPQKAIPVVLRPEFLAKPWLYRYAYMWMGLVIVRQKYYFAWKQAEGANNLWYAGFDGYDANGNVIGWNNCSNMDILKFETAQSIQILSKEWNKKTSLWLTRYVYIRTGGSLLAVYSMSAFWHGFYPGYYLFFLSVPLLTFCERLGRKKLSPYFGDSALYGFICMITTSIFAEYMVSPFPLLALDWSYYNWKSHYFFGHVSCIIFYIVVSLLPTPKAPADKKKMQ